MPIISRRILPPPSVAIAYDSRINSRLFAETAAGVFAANGIRVHIYPRLMPTPSLSFAVRDLRSCGGVVVTASHNPAKYNGYKVYGADGCQITTEAAAAIQQEIDRIDPFADIHTLDFAKGLASGIIAYIGEDTVERYLAAVSAASLLSEDVSRSASIVYTPLNGTGISCVPRCLRAHGFTNITIPPEQAEPDGTFPTCPYPNPEIREALSVGLRLAEETGSELLLATDPDCDRVGAAVKTAEGYRLITGNEMGVLLLDFVCRMRRANGTMPERPVAVKTIVTTPMAEKVAAHYGVELRNVLTGFKYIGEQIGLLEKAGEAGRYIFGFEESYGYLSGSFVRDKDAVNASLLICEMFVWYKSQGKTLADALEALYAQYGFFETKLLSFTFEGSAGFAHMTELLDSLRLSPPAGAGGRSRAAGHRLRPGRNRASALQCAALYSRRRRSCCASLRHGAEAQDLSHRRPGKPRGEPRHACLARKAAYRLGKIKGVSMATSKEYIEFVCEQLDGIENVTYRKMFGEYMVYVNAKPLLIVCDNTVMVKKVPELASLMEGAPDGVPYEGAKVHYILDIENRELVRGVIAVLEPITPLPKKRAKKKAE